MNNTENNKQYWYSRDASFWDNPNTRTPKRLHLMGKKSLTLCELNILLDEDSEWSDPPESLKCKKCLKKLQNKSHKKEAMKCMK